ncbi:MAG: hypothetical protein ACK2UO_04900 [Caldilineaceae bacterium]
MTATAKTALVARLTARGWTSAARLFAAIATFAVAGPCAQAATLTVSVTGTEEPGQTLTATGTYVLDLGEAFVSSNWSQVEGAPAIIDNPDDVSGPSPHDTDVTLASESDYAAHLVQVLKLAPITEDLLPQNVKLQPINEVEKGLQDRNQVVAINPFALEKAEEVRLLFTVETTTGTYTAEVDVLTSLPWVVSTGVKTVPLNIPLMLLAKCGEEFDEAIEAYECVDQTTFEWEITQAPPGSTGNALLMDSDARSPWFTPDVAGLYRLEESNGSGADLTVFAGTWHGVIDPVETLTSVWFGDGLPVADETCKGCHNGVAAPDNFTPWRATGHAEAFSEAITSNSHFGEGCFACHALGYQRDSSGIDSTSSYPSFLTLLSTAQASGDISYIWADMLQDMPDTARMANVQCENCHGPQSNTKNGGGGGAHQNKPGAPRVSLASDVCGSCHGEPFRHGRFQQWQLSNHADYDLARERGASSGDCARCHSGNGFVAWDKLDFDPNATVEVTWDEDSVVPQVCAACHDPHDTGTYAGKPNNAKVRVQGSTHELLAGFVAKTVGRGATCMTCHNSRRGLRNDQTWDSLLDSEKDDSPHHGVQADQLMGQNAYFMTSNELGRGPHSLLPDTCASCHMEVTDPPPALSFQSAPGTNHTFAADPEICGECHGVEGIADNVSDVNNDYLEDLQAALGAAWKRLMVSLYSQNKIKQLVILDCNGSDIVVDGNNPVTDVQWVYLRGTRLNVTVGGTTCTNHDPADIVVGKIFKNSSNTVYLKAVSLEPGSDVLWKAMWNYGLIYEDASIDPTIETARGVHFPGFAIKALTNAIGAVAAFNP